MMLMAYWKFGPCRTGTTPPFPTSGTGFSPLCARQGTSSENLEPLPFLFEVMSNNVPKTRKTPIQVYQKTAIPSCSIFTLFAPAFSNLPEHPGEIQLIKFPAQNALNPQLGFRLCSGTIQNPYELNNLIPLHWKSPTYLDAIQKIPNRPTKTTPEIQHSVLTSLNTNSATTKTPNLIYRIHKHQDPTNESTSWLKEQ